MCNRLKKSGRDMNLNAGNFVSGDGDGDEVVDELIGG